MTAERLIESFLNSPLYTTTYERGFGTIYTAAYWPKARAARFVWPDAPEPRASATSPKARATSSSIRPRRARWERSLRPKGRDRSRRGRQSGARE